MASNLTNFDSIATLTVLFMQYIEKLRELDTLVSSIFNLPAEELKATSQNLLRVGSGQPEFELPATITALFEQQKEKLRKLDTLVSSFLNLPAEALDYATSQNLLRVGSGHPELELPATITAFKKILRELNPLSSEILNLTNISAEALNAISHRVGPGQDQQPITCGICNKTYADEDQFELHLQVHSTQCVVCGASFAEMSTLSRHLLHHIEELSVRQ